MTTAAPANFAPAMAAHPTPPQPKTATESPRPTLPVNMAAPSRPSPRSRAGPTASGRAAGLTLVHCPAATSVLSAKAPMPRAGESGVPSASVIFWVALWVAKQYQGRPRRHARHSPHTARQLRTTKSPGRQVTTPGPTDSTTPAASWPSRKGKSSLMPPSR